MTIIFLFLMVSGCMLIVYINWSPESDDPPFEVTQHSDCNPDNMFTYTDFGKYKYILIDSHKAPQMDTLVSLALEFNVGADQIATQCGVNYCRYMNDTRDTYSQIKVPESIEKHFQREFIEAAHWDRRPRKPSAALKEFISSFDVIICTFPTWHCQELMDLGKVVVVRFSHAPWHILNETAQRRWLDTLTNMRDNPLHVVSSNNPYHASLFKYAVGYLPVNWPALYYHARGPNFQNTYDVAREGRGLVVDVDATYYGDSKRMHRAMVRHHKAHNQSWKLIRFKNSVKPRDIRHKVSLGVVFPYAMHTAKISEFYSLGVPLLVPSREVIRARCRQKREILPHRNSHPPVLLHAHCPVVLDPTDCDSTYHWIQFSEYWMWPHVYYYTSDNPSDIMKQIDTIMGNKGDRLERSRKMIRFFDNLRINGRGNIKKAIGDALGHYDRTIRYPQDS